MNMLQLLTKLSHVLDQHNCVPRLQKYALKLPISKIEEEILGREVENCDLNIKLL